MADECRQSKPGKIAGRQMAEEAAKRWRRFAA